MAASAEALGGIDILVNNAGRAHPGNFETLSDQDWQEDLDVKLLSMIRCSREALPHLRAGGGGRIVNINAVYGKVPGSGVLRHLDGSGRPAWRSPRPCRWSWRRRTSW